MIYKYGLEPDTAPGMIRDEFVSRSEDAGTRDGVIYSGNETVGGELEIRDGVAVMRGVNTAVDGKYAAMLVPWTILEPDVYKRQENKAGIRVNGEGVVTAETAGDYKMCIRDRAYTLIDSSVTVLTYLKSGEYGVVVHIVMLPIWL